MTIKQAAELGGYSEAHLRRLARRGGAFEAEMQDLAGAGLCQPLG
ncbi:MAG: hypothetical protein ACETWR_21600 [Anaerolineae bacterium]